MSKNIDYKSVKLEDEVYAKLQYLKKKYKCKSLSKLIDLLTEGK